MSLLARAVPRKAIDQEAQGQTAQGGVYIRLDDRSIVTQGFYDAQGTALSMSTVYACVRVLAESVAQLPFVLYRRLPGGGKERALDDPLYSVLHDQPNPEMTSFVWRELLMSHLTTWGKHYSEKVYDSLGRLQLWPIRPDRMEAKYNSAGEKMFVYHSPNGTTTEYPAERIFHVAGLSANGLDGLSPIALHRKTLRLAETAQEYGTNYLANGARPATILSHPKTLSDGAANRIAGRMDSLRGPGNSGKTLVLEEGLTVTEVGVPPEDAQYIETRKFQRTIIATEIFRVPPHMVGDLESGASYASIEMMSLEFVLYSLMPWLSRIEQECRAQLVYDADVYPEFLVDGLLRGDSKTRAESLAIQRQNGVINGDEWRELENRNPLPDGTGQTFWMPVNYAAAIPPGQPTAPPTVRETVTEPAPPLTVVKSAAVRCPNGHLLAEMSTAPYRFTCPKCKAVVEAA